MKEAASSDLFEIQSSQIAQERSDPETKAFADAMIADHQKTSREMASMIQAGKVKATVPTAMIPSHRGANRTMARISS